MFIFFIVFLALAGLLEYLSLRGGTRSVETNFVLSRTRSEPDELIEMTETVENLGRVPITYFTTEIAFPAGANLPEGLTVVSNPVQTTVTDVFRLWWRQRVQRSMRFSVSKRGVYVVTGKRVARGDFLGLRTESLPMDLRRSVLIYPRRLEDAQLLQALGQYCGELSARRWLIRDPILTLGIREYTGYEPMHTISWSQTARRGELMVREFDYTRSLNCCVIFGNNGLGREDEELLDRCCSMVRTVCEELIVNGVEADLYLNAELAGYRRDPYRKVSASRSREEDVLDVLARATLASCCPMDTMISRMLPGMEGENAFILIAPRDDQESRLALDLLRTRTGQEVLFLCAETLEGN